MKSYKYDYPDEDGNNVEVIRTEDEIIAEYWDYWYAVMVRIGKETEISRENCILDYVITNWAEEYG